MVGASLSSAAVPDSKR